MSSFDEFFKSYSKCIQDMVGIWHAPNNLETCYERILSCFTFKKDQANLIGKIEFGPTRWDDPVSPMGKRGHPYSWGQIKTLETAIMDLKRGKIVSVHHKKTISV